MPKDRRSVKARRCEPVRLNEQAAKGRESMSDPREKPKSMTRADMVMLESAIRNGWPVPDRQLRDRLRRFQAVLDDPRSGDPAHWRNWWSCCSRSVTP